MVFLIPFQSTLDPLVPIVVSSLDGEFQAAGATTTTIITTTITTTTTTEAEDGAAVVEVEPSSRAGQ